jgi:hypothetical protein
MRRMPFSPGQLAGCGLLFACFTTAVSAAEPAAPETPKWSFEATAFPTHVRGGDSYTSGIASAERGALHLELRANYESVGTRSAFVGWKFSGGETLAWEVTPIIGQAWGDIRATVPGVEWSLAWKRFDFYSEIEWVSDRASNNDSYVYSWNELGYSATDWLRIGVVGQRTRVYGLDRDFQRGPFVQFSVGKVTLGGYWFNPGSSEQVFVGSIGLAF